MSHTKTQTATTKRINEVTSKRAVSAAFKSIERKSL
jgi:hypothetical protein